MPTAPLSASPEQTERKPTVLVVEDEPVIRMYIADSLRDCGFEILEAGDGSQALTMLNAEMPIDLVFTDVTLPGQLDGFALAQWVRAQKPAIPIILTSGRYDMTAARKLCKDEPFFAKPYDISELAACIRTLLANPEAS